MATRRDAWRVLSVWTLLGLVAGWTPWLGGCDEEDNDWKAVTPSGHPDLALTMIIDMRGHASARELVTIGYVLTVRNLGDEDAMAVVVADTLPTAVTLQAAAADRGEYDPGDRILVARHPRSRLDGGVVFDRPGGGRHPRYGRRERGVRDRQRARGPRAR